MKTLIIKDLPVAAELDRKAMAAVHGGMSKSMNMSSYCSPYGEQPYGDVSKNDFSFDAKQLLGQSQETVVNNGNNVAFACGINATVNPCQTGNNSINFGH